MGKKLAYSAFGFILGMIIMAFVDFNINPLSNQLVNATMWYQQSDEMKAIYLQNFNWAKKIVEMEQIKNQNQWKLAVVVDIDETMLDNSPYEGMLVKTGTSFSPETWNKWVNLRQAKALPGAVDFTRFARNHGVEVFYISNRSVSQLEATIDNLKKEGFAFADKQHVLLRDKTSDKTERRKQVQQFYKVILYLGDNMGDFDQKYKVTAPEYDSTALHKDSQLFGTRYIVMPNPMYGAWERARMPKKPMTDREKAIFKIQSLIGF